MPLTRRQVLDSFQALRHYCEDRDFAGWDPYDGLNSRVFQATPLKHWPLARLAWIQAFKLSQVNLRRLLLVPKGHNAKGIGLFLTGYCNLYRAQQSSGNEEFGTNEEILHKISYLADLLVSMRSKGYSGACWGYNFDWESRAFFLPKLTPTVVATSFCVEALLGAAEATGNESYMAVAVSSADFILKDLNRIEKPGGFMFSYSPIDDRAVYNATLLGTKTLALINKHAPSPELVVAARASAHAVCSLQNPNGSFPHSDQVGNVWRDSFHTGFKLESLACYCKHCGDHSFSTNLQSGFDYWLENYFDPETGRAYYYDTKGDLVDLHCTAQALSTLYKLGKLSDESALSGKIADWAISNMQSGDGGFFFQRSGNRVNKIPYMRWPNAWMFYGLSYYLLDCSEHEST